MSKLPPIQTRSIPAAQQDWLKRWLVLWEDDRLLQSVPSVAPVVTAGAEADPLVQPYCQHPLQLGEIRLLAPHLTPASSEPVFVAVYSEWKPVGYMIAPFSRFPVPAFTGELFTGWKEAQLRVINVWNSFSMAPDALKASWLVDHLSEEECTRARALFRHTIFGHELMDGLSDLIGPPITLPMDPRLIYQREEVRRLSSLARLQSAANADQESDLEALIQEALRIANSPTQPQWPDTDGELIPFEQALCQQKIQQPALLAAAGDAPTNQVVVCRGATVQAGEKILYVADADGPVRIEQEQTLVPDVLWTLRQVPDEVAATFAGARVLFMQNRSGDFVAEGHVDDTGTIMVMDTLKKSAKAQYPVQGTDLVLFILPG